MTVKNPLAGYPLVAPCHMPMIPCCDFWPKERLTPLKVKTYESMRNDGYIFSLSKHTEGGMIAIRYMSPIPHEWIKQWLKDTYRQLAEQYGRQMMMGE